ncbi:unnamed protein product, partial [Ranitomeya imitator]
MIKDQFFHLCPAEVGQFVMDREPKDVTKAAQIADAYEANRRSEVRKPVTTAGEGVSLQPTPVPLPANTPEVLAPWPTTPDLPPNLASVTSAIGLVISVPPVQDKQKYTPRPQGLMQQFFWWVVWLGGSFLEWAVRDVSGLDSVIHYLDDFLCIGPDQSQCCEVLLRTVVWVAKRFGVPLAPGKTEGPCTSLSFLGIVIDSMRWEFRLPVDKVLGLRDEVAQARLGAFSVAGAGCRGDGAGMPGGTLERGVRAAEPLTPYRHRTYYTVRCRLPCFDAGLRGSSSLLVWIVGHSNVYWGARRADVRQDGRQLGFSRDVAVIRWLGFRGLGWNRVLEEVHNGIRLDRPPDILVLHVGGNDLGIHPCRELIRDIKHDMLRLWVSFREISIVWSEIVPRTSWRHARSVDKINKARIKVHLNAVGIDLWARGALQSGIERAIAVKIVALVATPWQHRALQLVEYKDSVIILYHECQCHYPVPQVSLSYTPSVSVIILYPKCECHYPVPQVSVSLSCTPSVSVNILYPSVSVIILYPSVSVIILYPKCQCHYPVPQVSVSLSCTPCVSVIILYPSVSVIILYPE